MMSIQVANGRQHFCGASLIAPNWALTAGHCVEDIPAAAFPQVQLEMGSAMLGGGETFGIAEIILHPDLELESDILNDIALVRLDRPASAQPILLDVAQAQLTVADFDEYQLVGWGDTQVGDGVDLPEILQSVILDRSSAGRCRAIFGNTYNDEQFICFTDSNVSGSSCNGDSGGPAIVWLADGTPFQVGVTSYGVEGCSPTTPSVYARVSNYMDWIQQHVDLPTYQPANDDPPPTEDPDPGDDPLSPDADPGLDVPIACNT